MKTHLYVVLIALVAAAVAGVHTVSAEGGPIVRGGNEVAVAGDQILEGDFYGLGGTLAISGEARGDVLTVGGNVTVNGNVAGDLAIMGGVVQVHGVIGDDVRVIGGEVTIANVVKGDVVVLSGTLSILSTASIEGDVLVLAGDVRVDGPVEGSVYGGGDRIRINAAIGGDVSVRATELLTLGDAANVAGSVIYKSQSDVVRAQNATVGGMVRKDVILPVSGRERARDALMGSLIFLFAALTFYFVLRASFERSADALTTSYGKYGLLGFGVVFAVPFLCVLLISSVLGMVVGALLLLLYGILMGTAWVGLGIVVGLLMERYVFKDRIPAVVSVVLGTVIFNILLFVPYVGAPVAVVAWLMVLGSLTAQMYAAIRA